jgi:hypothetical protein
MADSVHHMLLQIIAQQKNKRRNRAIYGRIAPYNDLVKLQSNNVGNVAEVIVVTICKSAGIPVDCDG